MSSLERTIDLYYNSPGGLYLTEYTAINDGSNGITEGVTPVFHDQEQLDATSIDEVLDEVSRNMQIISFGGSTFEISIANDNLSNDPILLHMSTYSSALSTNPGNAYEFAAQAVRYPNYKHLYVASFGNGGTSPLLPHDAWYSSQTGRFSKAIAGNTQPLDSILNLHHALVSNDLNVTRIMGTDSPGGHYARSLALAMEADQLSYAFFSETTGFVNLSTLQIVKAMLVQEQLRNSKENRRLSPDPEQMDNSKIERSKAALNKHQDIPNRVELSERKVRTAASIKSMLNSMHALRRGPTKNNNPLADDSNALIKHHPNAKLVYGLAERDPLYKDPETTYQAAQLLLGSLSVQKADIRAIIVPGMSHAYNTFFPSLYHTIEKYALEL